MFVHLEPSNKRFESAEQLKVDAFLRRRALYTTDERMEVGPVTHGEESGEQKHPLLFKRIKVWSAAGGDLHQSRAAGKLPPHASTS